MPSNVALFEKLMYVAVAIGVAVAALDFGRVSAQVGSTVGTLVAQAFAIGLLVLFIWLVARRRQNWARWVFLVFFVIGLVFYVPALLDMFRASTLIGLLSAVQMVIQLVALYLIFTGNSREWFAKA